MADVKLTKDVYKQYAHKIASVLDNEDFYEQFKKRVDSGASSFKLGKKRLIQDISIDWIDTIEEILPNLDTIVRNPRRFIVQEEDIVDVSLARSISTESVKFLAQHTNMISKVEDDGSVIPSKILNITKEESFEIYENRFIYTLLLKLKDFVTMRYDKIKKASATQDVLELDVESRFNLPSKKVTFRTEYFAQLSFDEVMRLDPDTLTKIERVAKIDRIITDFLSSSFAKSMRNSAPVRPPIMRTNVILKEPNFKKALTLWQFIETYNQTAGFSTTDDVEELSLEDESIENLRHMITLNTMLFESMYDNYETDMNMEDKQFGDFLRVGEMDFDKDEIERDQYAQKLDNKKENDEEKENIEEVKPEENEDSEREIPPEQQLPPEEEKKPDDKQVVQEKEVERPVEVERLKEMPPKADQEEVDLEPDAEKFDQHLFDVRKLYKRPDDDRLKQEDIVKVRDAIDRCLTSYRRIKQEEIEERDRQERIRRRKEDIGKRADAFSRQRAALAGTVDIADSSDIYFGMDPFSYQKAKLAAEKKEEERLEKLKLNKDENLELEGDAEAIAKEIDEMEAARAALNPQPAQEEEAQAPQPAEEQHEKPARKGKIRIAHDTSNQDPWTQGQKPAKEFEPVDESKVAVGGIRFNDGTDVDNPFGAGITGNKAEIRKPAEHADAAAPAEAKPKRPRKKKAPAPKPESAEEIKPEEAPKQEEKPAKPVKEFAPIDESKVAVGGIRFADGTDFDNPFGMGITGNKAEVRKPVAEPEQSAEEGEKSAEEVKPKRTRKKKAPQAKQEPAEQEPMNEAPEAKPETEEAINAESKAEEHAKDAIKKPAEHIEDRAEDKPSEPVENKSEEAETKEKPAKPDEVSEEKSKEPAEAPSDEKTAENNAKPEEEQPAKPKRKYNKRAKGEISPTTANQKYSKPSGKAINLSAVDEDKVSVGGISFKKGSGIFDPFADPTASLENRAETSDDEQ